MDPERLLVLKEVEAIVGLRHTAIYRRMQNGSFPAALSLGPRTVRWRWRDIEAWLTALKPTR
jgi:prophage regulatory protein